MWHVVRYPAHDHGRVDMGEQLRHHHFFFLPGLAHSHRNRGHLYLFQTATKKNMEKKIAQMIPYTIALRTDPR
jgi:hypothetical protein